MKPYFLGTEHPFGALDGIWGFKAHQSINMAMDQYVFIHIDVILAGYERHPQLPAIF